MLGNAFKPRRRSSVKIPLNDRFEKPDRHTSSGASPTMQEKTPVVAWSRSPRQTRYFKTGCLLSFALLLFYFLRPSEYQDPTLRPGKFPGTDLTSDASVGTTKCTKSYSSDKPLIQYALMIDAGSTGSRIHVYRFNNCGPTPELEDEVFEQTAKRKGGSGLSSYGADAQGAAMSLDVLMDVAMKHVPETLRGCTPVAVKATAGLRKLGTEMSDAILKAVRTRLETVYPFAVLSQEKGGVEVMDGKLEGVYAWVTTNYLLGKIGGPDKTPSAAVFDLGGGSTQIVFEPTFPHTTDQMEEGDHKYELTYGGRKFSLYQHSYLGYGLMEARNSLHRSIIQQLHESNPTSTAWLQQPISNPCLGAGTSGEVNVTMPTSHPLGEQLTVNMAGPATGSSAQCRALSEKILEKDADCQLAPCAFKGIYQPSLTQTFAREDLYLLSYFYDRTSPLGMPDAFTIRDLATLTTAVCAGPSSWQSFATIPGAMEELNDRPETCLDLSFMLALLNTGYEMPIDREVKIAKKIGGNELGWCLGASLPLLSQESGWTCRVDSVY